MEEKIYEEFVTKPWDKDEDRERKDKLEECIKIIKDLVDLAEPEEDYQDLILEIKSVVNSID